MPQGTLPLDLKVAKLQIDAGATPPDITAGAGVASAINRANGSLHMRTDADSLPECIHNGEVRKVGLSGGSIECRIGNLVANTANSYQTHAPRDGIITGVRRRYTAKPGSAGGTVVAGIIANGNQILASASEDEEGLSNDTLTAHNLTATAAHLKVSKGAKIIITVTSNNGDMTGGTGCHYFIDYDDN